MFKAKNRIWLVGKKGPFLGNGRIQLLEAIEECGSISEAAKTMQMSYKKAWGLVKSMNAEAGINLVERKTGGAGGGGAYVTPQGQKAMAYFKLLEEKCRTFVDEQIQQNPLELK